MMATATSTASTAFISTPLRYWIFLLLVTLVQRTQAVATLDDWRSRSIYQIITDRFARSDGSTISPCNVEDNKICGGTWQGIISKLDYIQGMGFTALWISPVVTNINGSDEVGEAYHGYWSKDITTLNPNMGTSKDLLELSQALHDRGMLFMIDVVANNYAYAGPGANTVFSDFEPFNKAEYFHPYCAIQDYNNDTDAQQCWLGNQVLSLPDLDTEHEFVKAYWDQWAEAIVANYSIDGFRIDAAKHVAKPFWQQFQPSAKVYTVGESLNYDPTYVCNYMSQALNGMLNYPMWASINTTFLDIPRTPFQGMEFQYNNIVSNCQDSTLLGTFLENQDQPRLANYTNDVSLLKNAMAFAMLTDGIPIIYYGSEQQFKGQADPSNREALWLSGYDTTVPLYGHLAAINAARNAVANVSAYNYWSSYWTWKSKMILVEDEYLVVRKGYDHSIVTVMTNVGESAADLGPFEIQDTNFLAGDEVIDVLACKTQTVKQYGYITTTITKGLPQVWISTSLMVNATTICPDIKKVATTLKTKTAVSKASLIYTREFFIPAVFLAAYMIF